MRGNRVATIVFLLALLLSACDLLTETGPTVPIPEPTATLDQTMVTQAAPNVPNTDFPTTPVEQSTVLRLWIPPAIAARTEAGEAVLAEQLLAYETERPDVTLVLEQKRASGPGGILSYLRTGRDIAPSVMPDLVAIPTDLLPTMAAENLIVPLDQRVDNASVDVLFPPAQALGRPDTTFLGYPFALTGLPHLAYNSNVLTGTLPLTWDRLIENQDHLYVLAADGLDGALLALEFYIEAGGQLETEAGQPALQLEPLTVALQQIQNGRDLEFFAPQDSSFNTTDQAWQSFLSGGGNIAQTTSDHFLGQTVAGMPIAYTVIPGIDSPLTPLVTGWAWAITTADPIKQEEAAQLIQNLTAAANLAAWSRDSNILPARRDALASWPEQEPYTAFVRQELERAQPLAISSSGKIVTVLGDAVFQVISGAKTAPQAAADAVNAMQS